MKILGKIRAIIDLELGGTKKIKISAPTPEARDRAIILLNKVMPQLEMLESAIQLAVDEEAREAARVQV